MVAENGEAPHEGPAVGVQLGKSHVNLSQQGALEPRNRKTKFEPLKGSGVHKEEGFFEACGHQHTRAHPPCKEKPSRTSHVPSRRRGISRQTRFSCTRRCS